MQINAKLTLCSIDTTDQCAEKYEQVKNHVMCIPEPDDSLKPTEEGVNDADREEILRVHNKHRSDVALGKVKGKDGVDVPSASRMQKMVSKKIIDLLLCASELFLLSSSTHVQHYLAVLEMKYCKIFMNL